MKHRGMLIFRERMRRNWSQEGLCRGICTVSYLSKIENGRAEPSEEILRLLLERLDLHTDPEAEAAARAIADGAWELLLSGRLEAFHSLPLREHAETYRAAAAGLDLMLLCAGEPVEPALEDILSPRQLALQRLLQGREDEAAALLPCAYCFWRQGTAAYERGNDAAALESLQAGYDLAAREGAPHLMLLCRMFIGNIYCNRQDMENLSRHYAVARRLARALGDEEALSVMEYNTAASQMETGDYASPLAYFSRLEDPGAMALHKLAICLEKTGRKEEALAALDRAESAPCDFPPRDLVSGMCGIVRLRLLHGDYLSRADYGEQLVNLFERCRRELPAGYARFHLPWMLEWLTANRRYRQAFELMQTFGGR